MSDPFDNMRRALKQGDAARVRALLESHPELNAKVHEADACGQGPAITGARSREMLDVLLEAGADINARTRWWAGGYARLSQERSGQRITDSG